MKTIAIIGAGPGLGLSIAKRFGAEGFRVALLSRNAAKLDTLVQELKSLNIEARAYPADVSDLDALRSSLQKMKQDFGSIDVLEFSPYAGFETFVHALQVRPEDAEAQLRAYVLPAILAVNELLPDMLTRGNGAFLFTTGFSAMAPIPMIGNAGIAMSGLRNYITNLHNELKEKGIYIGHLSIGTLIAPGTEGDPDIIAETWYSMYAEQNIFEATFPAVISIPSN
ncbi:SDR family NAD(P)-dependent oxidoreductase [Saccharibacillus sacchari]|uniref:SDR family NAD(P)-dependent oxidoreductase n=1 Tax=Saccharibacillus sacchari TaxID=456493 RepID=A0ACC6PE43_9BACL